MAKYVDFNELHRIYTGWLPQLESEEDAGARNGVEACIAILEDMRIIDIKGRLWGEWRRTAITDTLWCTSCNKINDSNIESAYCPNCGAKMVVSHREES